MTRVEILESLLDQISISADTLANFAAIHCDAGGAASYNMHAVEAMAQRIGATTRLALKDPTINAASHLVGHDLARALFGSGHERNSFKLAGDSVRGGAEQAVALVDRIRHIDATEYGRDVNGEEDEGRSAYLKSADELRVALAAIFAESASGESRQARGFLLGLADIIHRSDERCKVLKDEAFATLFEPKLASVD